MATRVDMERGGGEWRVGRGIQTFYLDAVGDTSMDTLFREWLPLVIVCILPLLCMVGANRNPFFTNPTYHTGSCTTQP